MIFNNYWISSTSCVGYPCCKSFCFTNIYLKIWVCWNYITTTVQPFKNNYAITSWCKSPCLFTRWPRHIRTISPWWYITLISCIILNTQCCCSLIKTSTSIFFSDIYINYICSFIQNSHMSCLQISTTIHRNIIKTHC